MAKTPSAILFGDPSTPGHKPDKRELLEYLLWLEGQIGSGGGGGGADYSDDIANLDAQIQGVAARLASAQSRPGDAPMLFSSTATGPASDMAAQTVGTVAVTEEGAALSIPGGATIWPRQDTVVEVGVLATIEWQVRRLVNSPDPLNDAVEIGLTWLDKNKNRISAGADQMVRRMAMTIFDGVVTERRDISKDHPDADITAPANAVYVRPYIKTYGDPASRTAVSILGLFRGGGTAGPAGSDGLPPSYEIVGYMIRWSQPDGTVGPWLDIGAAAAEARLYRDQAEVARDVTYAAEGRATSLVNSASASYSGFLPDTFYDLGRVTDPVELFAADLGRVTDVNSSGPAPAAMTAEELYLANLSFPVLSQIDVPPTLHLHAQEGVFPKGANFSRSSPATRVNSKGLVTSAPANVLRVDYDPVTGARKGWLIEEARTNLLTHSQDFADAAWNKISVTAVSNAFLAPDGTNTGDSLTANTSDTLVYRDIACPDGANLTFSIWLWCSTGSVAISFGIFRSNGAPVSEKAVVINTTPKRYQVTGTMPAGDTVAQLHIGGAGSFSSPEVAIVWGAQLEVGSFATSYIQTASAAITRSADALTYPVGAWFNQAEGTIYFDALAKREADQATVLHIDDASFANRLNVAVLSDGNIGCASRINDADYSFASTTPVVGAAETRVRCALSYTLGRVALVCNGVLIGSSAMPSAFTVPLVSLRIGSLEPLAPGYGLNNSVSRVVAFPRALSDADLVKLTA